MTSTSLQDRALGDLASSIPGATAILRHHQLDFCCGGQQTLAAAAAARALDADAIADELAALQQQPDAQGRDWRTATASELIDHILQRYHQRHREQLPELAGLARRVESVHSDSPMCPHGLADHLQTMSQELDVHMQKEEHILFPLIRSGVAPAGLPPVAVMRHEHEGHAQALARMVELAHDMNLPEDACNTWRALHTGLQRLRDDLMQHIHLENNVLFEGRNAPDARVTR